jgi:hypothetical protein
MERHVIEKEKKELYDSYGGSAPGCRYSHCILSLAGKRKDVCFRVSDMYIAES